MCCYKALGCQKGWNSSCQIPSKFHWKNAFSCSQINQFLQFFHARTSCHRTVSSSAYTLGASAQREGQIFRSEKCQILRKDNYLRLIADNCIVDVHSVSLDVHLVTLDTHPDSSFQSRSSQTFLGLINDNLLSLRCIQHGRQIKTERFPIL